MWHLQVLIIFPAIHQLTALDINLALRKPTRMSNQYSEFHLATLAVDGNLAGFHRQCAHTSKKPAGTPNWWVVNLEDRYTVHRVAIKNRDSHGERLNNFSVTLWEVDPGPLIQDDMDKTYCTCLHYPGVLPSTGLINLPCSTNCTGQFLAVILPSDYLTLCEVEVYGQLLNFRPRQSMYVFVMHGKRAPSFTLDHSTYSVKLYGDCITQCISNNDCFGMNYVYSSTSSSRTCQLLPAITNPGNDTVDDSNSDWLIIRKIKFI